MLVEIKMTEIKPEKKVRPRSDWSDYQRQPCITKLHAILVQNTTKFVRKTQIINGAAITNTKIEVTTVEKLSKLRFSSCPKATLIACRAEETQD